MTASKPQRKNTKKGKYLKPKTNTPHTPATTPVATNRSGSVGTINSNRRHTKKNKYHSNLKRMYNKISKKDVKWYWDLKKWSPILILIFVIIYAIGFNRGEAEQIAYFETMPVETIYIEVEGNDSNTSESDEVILDEEAVALAILADSSAAGKSDEVKRILMWVAINRVEDRSNGYGGTLIDEINRPKQWQGYDPEGMYLQSTYDIALEVLSTWKNNGPRPIYKDMLWSVYNADGSITVRNRYNDTKGRNEQTFG